MGRWDRSESSPVTVDGHSREAAAESVPETEDPAEALEEGEDDGLPPGPPLRLRLWEWMSLRNWREHLAGTGSCCWVMDTRRSLASVEEARLPLRLLLLAPEAELRLW